jgi:hypothetical protein
MRALNRAKGDWVCIEAVKHGKGSTLFVLLFEGSAAKLGLLVALAALIFTQTLLFPCCEFCCLSPAYIYTNTVLEQRLPADHFHTLVQSAKFAPPRQPIR